MPAKPPALLALDVTLTGQAPSKTKSDAFFSNAWSITGSDIPVPPSPIIRRASDSCLPPPCSIPVVSVTPVATLHFRERLESGPSFFMGRSTSCDTVASSFASSSSLSPSLSIASTPSSSNSLRSAAEIETRLEEAVRHFNVSNDVDTYASSDDDHDEDEDMYNDHPSSSCTLPEVPETDQYPFIPRFPLGPLQISFQPQHRLSKKSLKAALSSHSFAKSPGQKIAKQHKRVGFAPCVTIVDVFAGEDYPGRHGPLPIERLSMRDILELREVKMELGVFSSGDDNSSTGFENVNIDIRGTGNMHTGGSSVSIQPSLLSSSSSTYSAASTSSTLPSLSLIGNLRRGIESRASLNSTITALPAMRDDSPESYVTSAFSSPELSTSCSPSASESDFANLEEDDLRLESSQEASATTCEGNNDEARKGTAAADWKVYAEKPAGKRVESSTFSTAIASNISISTSFPVQGQQRIDLVNQRTPAASLF